MPNKDLSRLRCRWLRTDNDWLLRYARRGNGRLSRGMPNKDLSGLPKERLWLRAGDDRPQRHKDLGRGAPNKDLSGLPKERLRLGADDNGPKWRIGIGDNLLGEGSLNKDPSRADDLYRMSDNRNRRKVASGWPAGNDGLGTDPPVAYWLCPASAGHLATP